MILLRLAYAGRTLFVNEELGMMDSAKIVGRYAFFRTKRNI